jgi:DNA-binding beta-propeller fold protein YncE
MIPGRFGTGPRAASAVLGLTVVVVTGLLLFSVPAQADVAFCPPGSGAGQCNGQSGVASDFESGRVYVADTENNRIDVFKADGEFESAFGWGVDTGAAEPQTCTTISDCQAGLAGSGNGQFNKPRRIAVDNNADPSQHDVYVFDSNNLRVEKFKPNGEFIEKKGSKGTGQEQFNSNEDLIAVGPGGTVYVGDTPKENEPRIEEFEPSLAFFKECKLPHEDQLNGGLAVDSAGNIYSTFNKGNGVFKFNPSCEEKFNPLDPSGHNPISLAIGEGNHLFVAESEGRVGKAAGSWEIVTEFEPNGTYLKRFGYGLGFAGTLRVNALAPFPSTEGDVFASLSAGSDRVSYLSIPPPGPVIAPLSLKAQAGSTHATLAAELNPEGIKPTKYHFEYVDQESFVTEGGFASPHTKETAEEEVVIAPGTPAVEEKELFSLHAGEVQIGCSTDPVKEVGEGKCLVPETKYRYRVVASNAGGSASFEDVFETKNSLEITETWASEAGTTGARLSARVDPLGVDGSGFFEYVDQESFEVSGFAGAREIPDVAHGQSPLDFGSGAASIRSVNVDGLIPGVEYHYRLVATDALLKAPVDGPERVLRPFATPVSGICPNEEFRLGVGALLADCRAYEMVSPLDKDNGDIVPLGEFKTEVPAALDESATSGERVSYTSYRAFGDSESAPISSEYIAERGEKEWESHAIQSPQGALVVPLFAQINTEFKLFSPDLCYAWQRAVAEPPLTPDAVAGYSNLYRRTDQGCGGAPTYEAITTVTPPHADQTEYASLELQGVSADGNVAIYIAPDDLAPGLPEEPVSCVSEGKGCQLRLYEKRAGQEPRFVCFLPGGEPVAPCQAGGGGPGIGNGIEGSFHNAVSADGERIYWTGGGKIYARVGGAQTLAVSAGGEALSGTSTSLFLGASADGSKAIFRTEKAGVSDLYEYDADKAEGEATTLVTHRVVGVAGMSEDGANVYFASEEEIVGTSGAVKGKPNLYLDDEGKVKFIATLARGDVENVPFSSVTEDPIKHMARVSGDGSTLAFITTANPTGYDNTDVTSPEECDEGHPQAICDAELFLYQANANEGKGRLVCVSCNSSGARPAGIDISSRIHIGTPTRLFAAGWIPAWENNQYASRALAPNGKRLFFEASDALSPLDTNGVTDVYEWEEAGEGTCTQASASFLPVSGGCVDLVSSGKSPHESLFIDADPSGKNAFFTTLSSLVPQDPGLVDVYDAREGGGLPAPVSRKAECEGEACQSPPQAPNDPTPASLSFEGAGNLTPPSSSLPVPLAQPRSLTRAQKLARALRACHGKPRRKRVMCEKHARKQYGTKATSHKRSK